MKNIGLLFLFVGLVCSSAYAKSAVIDPSILLYVHIKNATNQDCVLKKHYIALGALANSSQIPDVIFRDREAFLSMTWTFQGEYLTTALLMTFQCGEDKDITLYTNTPNIDFSSILERNNMHASFTYQFADNRKAPHLPWAINWTLKEVETEQEPDAK
ncbi:MAG: hypothetical protein KBB94_02355 [Legionellaceae bacterium]|nr:hypothetical protein [Legionellaceae bacterium]MBP9774935.1 hypothetical protein [Legionellaceae bacterium]